LEAKFSHYVAKYANTRYCSPMNKEAPAAGKSDGGRTELTRSSAMKNTTNIEALIAYHVAAAFAPVVEVPESFEVRMYRVKMERQAKFDASPVWKRGL
jgi:hypothetical protein